MILSEEDHYIRFIIFHTPNTQVESIAVLIDTKLLYARINVNGMIYSVKFDPSKYIYGVHELSIRVCLTNDKCNYYKRPFSFVSICPEIPNTFLSNFFLTANWSKTPYYGFILLYILYIILLLIILNGTCRLYSFNKMKFWVNSKTIQICLKNTNLYVIYPCLLPFSNIYCLSELIQFIFKRCVYFIHLWNCRIYLFYFIFIPFLPISFHNFHTDMFYIYTFFGAYYPFKHMTLYPMDAEITYFVIMITMWFPMLIYMSLFSNGNEMLVTINSKVVKYGLYMLKYMLLIVLLFSLFLFGYVWTSMDYPESLCSPIVFNCIFIIYHCIFYQ